MWVIAINEKLKFFIHPLLIFLKILFTFREKGRKGESEGEKHQCARDTSTGCLSHAPKWGPGLQPRHVP